MNMDVSGICFCGNDPSSQIAQENRQKITRTVAKELKKTDYYATKMAFELKLVSAYMKVRNGVRNFLGIKDKPVTVEEVNNAIKK